MNGFTNLTLIVLFVATALLGLSSTPGMAEPDAHRAHPRLRAHQRVAPIPLPAGIDPPAYKPGPNPFHPGEELVYVASWIGVPAATAHIRLAPNKKDPKLWTAQAWLQTNKFVDLLYRMRDYLREDFAAQSFAPEQIYIRQAENRRIDEYDVTFDHTGKLVKALRFNHHGVHESEYLSSNPFGPLSGAVMALSQPLEPGQSLSFDVFTGGKRFVFDFHVKDRERIRTQLGTFDALRIVPTVPYMSDEKLNAKARDTTIWVSADERHLPLRIQAAAFIGYVRADLVEVRG
jgi:hypothetical protein